MLTPFVRRVPALATYILVIVALALAILWFIPANYYIIFPGQAQLVSSMISAPGHRYQPSSGGLYDTYVNEFKANRLLYVLFGLLRSDVTVEPASAVSSGCPDPQYEEQLMAMMTDSKIEAEAAALNALSYKIRYDSRGPEVEQVYCNVPAASVLQAGDRILAIDGHAINGRMPNGKPIDIFRQVQYYTESRPPGSVLHMTILRRGNVQHVAVRTVHADRLDNIISKGGHAMIGIMMTMPLKFPVKLHINSGDVGGPSAGLAFTLGIIQQLTHRNLTHGNRVAVTGTVALKQVPGPHGSIEYRAEVGAIGGARQKALAAQTAGARYFLVPAANYSEALSAHAHLKVIPVNTLGQALKVLRSLRSPGSKLSSAG